MSRKPVSLIDLMIHLADQDEATLDAESGGTTGASSLCHEHSFVVWGSDTRFARCAGCGATQRIDIHGGIEALASPNPCVQRWGIGPARQTCGQCCHLRRLEQSKVWYKCELRDDLTHSQRTDQRMRWPACARFESRRSMAAMHGDTEVVLLLDGRYYPMVGGHYFIIEHAPRKGEVLSRAVRISFATEREAQRFLDLRRQIEQRPGGG